MFTGSEIYLQHWHNCLSSPRATLRLLTVSLYLYGGAGDFICISPQQFKVLTKYAGRIAEKDCEFGFNFSARAMSSFNLMTLSTVNLNYNGPMNRLVLSLSLSLFELFRDLFILS